VIRVEFDREVDLKRIFPEESQWYTLASFRVFDGDKQLNEYMVAMDNKGRVTLEHKDVQPGFPKTN